MSSQWTKHSNLVFDILDLSIRCIGYLGFLKVAKKEADLTLAALATAGICTIFYYYIYVPTIYPYVSLIFDLAYFAFFVIWWIVLCFIKEGWKRLLFMLAYCGFWGGREKQSQKLES